MIRELLGLGRNPCPSRRRPSARWGRRPQVEALEPRYALACHQPPVIVSGVLTVNCFDQDDTITLDRNEPKLQTILILNGTRYSFPDFHPDFQFASIHISSGGGNDGVNLRATMHPVRVDDGDGSDTVSLGGTKSGAQRLLAPVALLPSAGSTKLIVDDTNDLQGRVVTVSATFIAGMTPQPIMFGPLTALCIWGGQGNDIFTFESTPPNAATELNAGGGDDHMIMKGVGDGGSVTLDGGPGVNTLEDMTDGNATWNILGLDQGTLVNPALCVTVMFNNVCNVTDNAQDGVVNIFPGGRLSGKLEGNLGRNTLSYSLWTDGVEVRLVPGLATNVDNGVCRITRLIGGEGNDHLEGDEHPNTLLGNGGSDTLLGGDGRDILIGGAGADMLDGGAGEDILIGGTFVHDDVLAALTAIREVWTNPAVTYLARVMELRSSKSYPLSVGSTVSHDGDSDMLRGGAGELDWLFFDGSDCDDSECPPVLEPGEEFN